MSWCSEWIRDWLREGSRSQVHLASLGQIDPANVSRWLSGQSRPDREAVARLLTQLDDQDASTLLVAWLKDLLPEGAACLVKIEPQLRREPDTGAMLREIGSRTGLRVQGFPPGMSEDLRERLLFFGELAVGNPDIRKILDVCYQAAKRSEPSPPESF